MFSVYQVATIDTSLTPHVRSQVHRGFVIPRSSPSTPLLLTSSDVRAPKIAQMHVSESIEVAWWMEGSQDQFRITGRARVVSSPDTGLTNILNPTAFEEECRVLGMEALHHAGEDGEGNAGLGSDGTFDWEKKRQDIFEAMRPGMKATWCRPVAPGAVLSSYDDVLKWPKAVPYKHELTSEEDKRNYAVALGNFAMVVLEPLRVDWVQMGEHPNRRTLFTRKHEDREVKWIEEILAP